MKKRLEHQCILEDKPRSIPEFSRRINALHASALLFAVSLNAFTPKALAAGSGGDVG
jgi:hypothetical protein